MDGRYITEARTAAVSAVSAKLLAREDAACPRRSSASGVQARSHLDALSPRPIAARGPRLEPDAGTSRGVRQRRCAGLTRGDGHAGGAAARRGGRRRPRSCSPRRLASRSSRTTGSRPGAHRRSRRLPPGPARDARARSSDAPVSFVDSRAGALAEAGDVVLPIGEGALARRHIAAELGDWPAASRPADERRRRSRSSSRSGWQWRI